MGRSRRQEEWSNTLMIFRQKLRRKDMKGFWIANAKHYNNRILIWFTGLIDGTESVSMIKEVKLRCSPVVVSTTAYRFVQRDHSSLPGIRDEPTPPEWLLKEREREWVMVRQQ